MARPYQDGAELRVEPVDPNVHPLVAPGTVILLGIGFPAVDGPVPIMLSPGSEYRIRQVEIPGREGTLWVLERRRG